MSWGSKFEQLPRERKAGPEDPAQVEKARWRENEVHNIRQGQIPKKKKNDEEQGVGGDGEVCGWREAVQKTKRYQRRMRESPVAQNIRVPETFAMVRKRSSKAYSDGHETTVRGLLVTLVYRKHVIIKLENTSMSNIYFYMCNFFLKEEIYAYEI